MSQFIKVEEEEGVNAALGSVDKPPKKKRKTRDSNCSPASPAVKVKRKNTSHKKIAKIETASEKK